MQHNVTDLTQQLLGALDGDYNVTNMATIIDVITLLEKVAITKEMLETTRLGKHINEMRKHIANDALAKRAKLLVKKWRNIVLVAHPGDANNGQLRVAVDEQQPKKRPPTAVARLDAPAAKKQRANGGAPPAAAAFDYDFSDNSNSSFKDVAIVPPRPAAIVVVNSDSNSSIPDGGVQVVDVETAPKKRGRKKGSKNHKNLVEEAETSFSNKMAVSRGNAKVKTTQELIESLQQRAVATATVVVTSPTKSAEDWRERAAKLTERVSLIDQKLNTGAARNKKRATGGTVLNHVKAPPLPAITHSDADSDVEIVVVDDDEPPADDDDDATCSSEHEQRIPSLSVEEARSRLPPIDLEQLHVADDDDVACLCVLDDEEEAHADCPARAHLEEKYRLSVVDGKRVEALHATGVDDVNGNFGSDVWLTAAERARLQPVVERDDDDDGGGVQKVAADDDVTNIVPTFYELPAKQACSENFKKYSISEAESNAPAPPPPPPTTTATFREFHECLDRPSYNGELLRILPYVVID